MHLLSSSLVIKGSVFIILLVLLLPQVVMAMRDLFQVVYDLKKKDVEKNKYSFDSGSTSKAVGSPWQSARFHSGAQGH